MFRRRYSFKKRGRYGRKSYRKFKSQYGFFRRGGQYRRLYKSFRRYKKFKRSGVRLAQRRYQRTKYRVNNMITPDELVVSFKRNGFQRFASNTPTNLLFSVFGCQAAEWPDFQNITEVAKKFKMVEFLSGSMSLYFFNNMQKYIFETPPEGSLAVTAPTTLFVAYQTARRWQPQTGTSGIKQAPQQEILFPDVTSKTDAWSYTAELPGVSGKFICNAGGAKPSQKLKWKFTQKSWKSLKADRTGFQANIDPTDGSLQPSAEPYFPVNNAVVKLGFDIWDLVSVVGNLEMYGSQRITLKFKGRRE